MWIIKKANLKQSMSIMKAMSHWTHPTTLLNSCIYCKNCRILVTLWRMLEWFWIFTIIIPPALRNLLQYYYTRLPWPYVRHNAVCWGFVKVCQGSVECCPNMFLLSAGGAELSTPIHVYFGSIWALQLTSSDSIQVTNYPSGSSGWELTRYRTSHTTTTANNNNGLERGTFYF